MRSASLPATISGDLPADDVVDGPAIAADRIGVADAFGAIGIPDRGGDQLEMAHLAMGAVGQRDRQRHLVEAALEGFDSGHRGSCSGEGRVFG